MLLSLLGVCALVGPFQGPEWEPVRGLLAGEDHSCRQPQCCGNLLVSCLFAIWQVRHCWCWFTRTCSSRKKASKVSPRKQTVTSRRLDTRVGLTPETHFSPPQFQELEAHVQQWAQKRRGHWPHPPEAWPLYLLPWPSPCPGTLTSTPPLGCTASFPGSSALLPDSVWESWQGPWTLGDDQIYKCLSPAVELYERVEHLLIHTQEELVSLEPIVNIPSDAPSVSLTTALSTLPSAQKLPICSRESRLAPSSQHRARSSRELGGPCADDPGRERRTAGREEGQQSQARGCVRQRASSLAPGQQLGMDVRREDSTEACGLGRRDWTLAIRHPARAGLRPDSVGREQMGTENRTVTAEELGGSRESRGQRERGHETSGAQEAGVQAHRGENQGPFTGEMAVETLTSGRGVQDKSRNKGAVETQVVEENRRAAHAEARGMGEQNQAGGEPGRCSPAQIPGDSGTGILAGGGRHRDQDGRGKSEETHESAGDALGEVRKDGAGTQEGAVTSTPARGPQRAGQRQTSRAEIQKQLKYELQMWGSCGLRREEEPKKKKLREIREEDWVVIQALWWADRMPAVGSTARESGLANGERCSLIAEIQTAARRGQGAACCGRARAVGTEAGAPCGGRGEAPAQACSLRSAIRKWLGVNGTGVPAPRDSDLLGETHSLRREAQDRIGDKDGARTQAAEAGTGDTSPQGADEETHSSEQEEEERAAGEEGTEPAAPEKNRVAERAENGEEGNQSQAGGERGTESEAPQQRGEREAGGQGVAETPSTVSGAQGPLGGDSAESLSLGRQDGEQAGGEVEAEEQGSEAAGTRGHQTGSPPYPFPQLPSTAAGQMGWAELPAQGEMGGENGVDIQGRRSPGGPRCNSETQTGAPGEEPSSQIDGETRVPGPGHQGRAEVPGAGSQSVTGSREDKDQSEGVGAPRTLHVESSAGQGPPALTGPSHEASGEDAEASASCPERLPPPGESLSAAEGELWASRSKRPGRKHRGAAVPASSEAPAKPRRRARRNKAVGGAKASGPTLRQSPDPPSLPAHSGLPSRPRGQVPKAAPALGAPRAPRTAPPKALVLKKSQQLLLESLMRMKTEHLQWGLPQRVLESSLLCGYCPPPPLAGTRAALQPGPQERPGETQHPKAGVEVPERTPTAWSPDRKSCQLPPQGRGLEARGPHWRAGLDLSRRVQPAGGLREPRDVPEAAGPRATLPECQNCCGAETVPGVCRGDDRGRDTGRRGISQVAQRAPSRARATHSSSGPGSQDAPEPPRSGHQLPTLQSKGSLEPAESSVKGAPCPSRATGAASLKESLQCAAARLGTTLWNRINSSPLLARRQLSVPTPRLRHPDALLPFELGLPDSGEDGVPLQSPDRRCAGPTPLNTDVPHSQGALKKPRETPRNLAASAKSGLVKHLRYFLWQRSLKK